jgi:transcriptional regulator with XRE-family HTH domain
MSQEICEVIRVARERQGLTKRQLARRIGCSEATVSLWESGKRSPGVEAVEPLVEALGLDLASFENTLHAQKAREQRRALRERFNEARERRTQQVKEAPGPYVTTRGLDKHTEELARQLKRLTPTKQRRLLQCLQASLKAFLAEDEED